MNNVFHCPICFSKYQEKSKVPITLQCGHVVCKSCLKNLISDNGTITCAFDKKVFPIDSKNLSSLPVCHTILEHLPSKESSEFTCKWHPTKKVKYLCTYDNESFCAKCLVKHSKSPHKVNQFLPQKNWITDEVELIKKHIEDKKTLLVNISKRYSECKQKLLDKTKEQLEILDIEMNNIICNLRKKKEMLEDKIKSLYRHQTEELDTATKNLNSNISNLQEMMTNVVRLQNSIENRPNLFFEEVMEEKKKVIQEWELFLRGLKITSLCSVMFPKLKVDLEKIGGIEHKLFLLETFPFDSQKWDEAGVGKASSNNSNNRMTTNESLRESFKGGRINNKKQQTTCSVKQKPQKKESSNGISVRKCSDPQELLVDKKSHKVSPNTKKPEIVKENCVMKKLAPPQVNESDDSDIKDIICNLNKCSLGRKKNGKKEKKDDDDSKLHKSF